MSKYKKFSIKGDKELIRRVKKLSDKRKVKQAVALSANDVMRKAQAKAPVDTGHLKESINVKEVTQTKAIIIANSDYSGYVEFGTRYMRAQPYMRPAVKEVVPEFQEQLWKAVKDSR